MRGVSLAFVFAWVAGCDDPAAQVRMMPEDGKELPILRHVEGAHSHETTVMRVVIRDEETWAQLHITDMAVDFEHEMALVVTSGTSMSDQYRIVIERVWREGSRIKVRTHTVTPPPGASLEPAAPFFLAIVPRCDLNVEGFSATLPRRERPWMQSPGPGGL